MSPRRMRLLVVFGLLICDASLLAEERLPKKRVAPVYPALARKMHVSGIVRLEVDVNPEGDVQEIKVVKGHALLREAAIAAAKQWVFAKASAKTVEIVEVDFQQ